jgi:hypothetical protein
MVPPFDRLAPFLKIDLMVVQQEVLTFCDCRNTLSRTVSGTYANHPFFEATVPLIQS